jgi:hypothetical protein
MPSIAHEVVLQVLREEGVLAEVLRRARGLRIGSMALSDPNISEVNVTEWRGDALFVSNDPKRPSRWSILELQASIDSEKLRTIPLSFELARDRFRVPGDIVLVTVGAKVARWFDRHPFRSEGPLGTKRALSVIRVDLARLPVSKLLDGRTPSLAALAVAAHAKDPLPTVRRVAQRALQVTGRKRSRVSSTTVDAILNLLDAKLRRELEDAMEREGYRTGWLQDAYLKGKGEGETKGEAKGEAKGMREALARVVAKRGLKLSARARARIDSEGDVERLGRWLDAAVTATSIANVFAEPSAARGSLRSPRAAAVSPRRTRASRARGPAKAAAASRSRRP